jgi:His/Glu/Gln/Arg/opine family amino acid ABC transporter permease subunit
MPSEPDRYRRQSARLTLRAGICVAVLAALDAFQEQLGIHSVLFATLRTNFYNDFIKADRYLLLVNGLLVTLQITVFSVLAGTVIGLLLALIKVLESNGKYLFFLTRFTNIYLTVIRGTPVVVQLMIIYYGIFASVNIDKIFVAILAFSINSGAYVAEIIRAGILAVDRGRWKPGEL